MLLLLLIIAGAAWFPSRVYCPLTLPGPSWLTSNIDQRDSEK